ncbi:zinc ABC transporter substrate-binding protein [Alkalicoccus chagannorensis]
MKRTALPLFLTAAVVLAACGNENNEMNDTDTNENINNPSAQNNAEGDEGDDVDPVSVQTTLYPLEYFAERIGGDDVEVENMVPVGADAHTFEPTANQMIETAEAELFIYNGADFEGFISSIQDAIEGEDVQMVEAVEGIELLDYSHDHNHDDEHDHNNEDHNHDDEHNHNNDDLNHNDEHNHNNDNHNHEDEHDHNNDDANHNDADNNHDDHAHGDEDPHVWLDPMRAADMAENIKHALVEARPEASETFEANFDTLVEELEELDGQFEELADNMDRDHIVVSHAGYGYWEARYGIHQTGIAGLSPTNEPSIQQIEETIEMMEENNINHVMFEQNIPVDVAETVREETGAEELWLHNLEAKTEEDLENEEDYFSLMEGNLEALEEALFD